MTHKIQLTRQLVYLLYQEPNRPLKAAFYLAGLIYPVLCLCKYYI